MERALVGTWVRPLDDAAEANGELPGPEDEIPDPVDVCRFEACKLDIEIEINELLQFDRQNFPVPTDLLGQPVVGQDVRPFLGGRQVGEPDRR
jgi:hypothetical protein